MGITLSSRSPAMAYADGGMWVSTFDEIGQRCWVNTITGQRTYEFIGGKPVASIPISPAASSAHVVAQSPHPAQSPHAVAQSPYAAQHSPVPIHHTAPWAESSPSPTALPPPTYAAPPAPDGAHGAGGSTGGAVVSYIAPPGYETGAPPVTPTGNGLLHRLQKYYLRPSTERSWMWRQ